MVTNTAGTTTTDSSATVKENGECEKDRAVGDELSSLKQNTSDNSKPVQGEKVLGSQQNDTSNTMPSSLSATNDGTSFIQTSRNDGIPSTANYNAPRPAYGNGLPPPTTVMNGPVPTPPNVSYPNYGSYNHNSPVFSGKPGLGQVMQSGPSYPLSMQQTYPSNQQPTGATPTLNQLLATPSRYPSQYPAYTNQQQHSEYGQGHSQQQWQARPQQYARAPTSQEPQGKTDMGGYTMPPQQHQYPPSQHVGYPTNQTGRYPAPPNANQVPYSQPQQYNPSMPPPASSAYPPATPSPSRHPSYSNYNYNQQPAYYSQRPPMQQSYPPPPAASHPPITDGKAFHQEQTALPNASTPLVSDVMHQQNKERMMSPNRRTPQPAAAPGPVPSPMSAVPSSHIHPGHPSVAQLRGPSPAPGSPASAGQARATPLSPPLVRPGTPHQQVPMRSASEHSDHSSISGQSPMPGPGYSSYRPHPSQQSYVSQPPNYPQHMMSPQQQPAYPSNQPQQQQQIPPVSSQHQGPSRPAVAPPSGSKPMQQMQASVPQNYNQAQQPAAYQQPGGHMHYYDNMPQQHHHAMQGYNSSSPAPTERRPSRQGSHPSVSQTPDQMGRQGAAAAAAAAMAAAAHSAQPGSVPGHRPQAPGYYPQHIQQRPQHPNYSNMQLGGDAYQQNSGYPRIPHPGAPTSGSSHRMSGTLPSQGMHRMPPPAGPYPGYGGQPSAPAPQGHYAGYYPPNSGDPNHPQTSHPGYQATASFEQSPQTPQEEPKKPAARSASQKLAALFEPAEEPGRREFIESVLRYWEDKDIPLKNAPLMGRKTLDLFRLYQIVKEKGGMQEVTSSKKWAEISAMLGLGTTTTSGFTLKKQYCKYLYGFECKVERGEPEPQEAMARITEANRKRKQATDALKEDKAVRMMQPNPPMHPLPSSSIDSTHAYQQYPPGQYPPQRMVHQYLSSGQTAPNQNYVMPQNTAGPYPQHPSYGSSAAPYQGPPPAPSYPNMATSGTSYEPRMPLPSVHASNSYPMQSVSVPQPQVIPASEPLQTAPPPPQASVHEKPSEPPAGIASKITDAKPPAEIQSSAPEVSSSIRPPVPASSTLAASNPFSYSTASQYPAPPPPTASPGYAPHTVPQPYTPRPPHDPYRHGYPSQSGMQPTSYPYSNNSLPHARPPSVPSQRGVMRTTPSASPRASPYPMSTQMPSRPPQSRPGQYSVPGNSYGSSMGSPYPGPGMKRRSSDVYGPPSKYIRPDGQPGYPPNHPSYRADSSSLRHRYPSPADSSTHRLHDSASGQRSHSSFLSSYSSSHPSASSHTRNALLSRPRWGPPGVMPRTRSPLSYAVGPKHPLQEARLSLGRSQFLPRSPYPHISRDVSIFPLGSIEATQPRLGKFHRKTCFDVGSVEGWRIVMALKSGLLVESTWALNTLTVLLYDQMTVAQFKLSQLPGLLDALVEHFRRCLSELFNFSNEREALGIPSCSEFEEDLQNGDVFEMDELNLVNKSKTRGKRKKGCSATAKLRSKLDTYPIKVELRHDPFLVDACDQWDNSKTINLADDLSHIVLSLYNDPNSDVKAGTREYPEATGESVPVIEATLEDVLSIPCAVLSPDDFDLTKDVEECENIENVQTKTEENAVVGKKLQSNKETNGSNQTVAIKIGTVDEANEVKATDQGHEKVTCMEESCDQGDSSSTPAANGPSTVLAAAKSSTVANENSLDTLTKSGMKEEAINKCDKNCEDKEEDPVKHNEKTKEKCTGKSDLVANKPDSTARITPVCNGLQVNCVAKSELEERNRKEKPVQLEGRNIKLKQELKSEYDTEIQKFETLTFAENKMSDLDARKKRFEEISITTKVKKVLQDRNVVLLDDEAAGRDGGITDNLSGPLLCAKLSSRRDELSNRLQCLSNILRSLSFIPYNAGELCQQKQLLRVVSGLLLLRHKHKMRPERVSGNTEDTDSREPDSRKEDKLPSVGIKEEVTFEEHDELTNNKCRVPWRENGEERPNCVIRAKDYSKPAKRPSSTNSSKLFAPKDEKRSETDASDKRKRCRFSSAVLDRDTDDVYTDPWWWDCVRRVREDALVIFANISPSVDLSVLPDDNVPLAVLEACLHWSVCPSSDACDSFTLKSRNLLSPQRLSLEILAKLSIKDQNVDLILATRPFSRVEKLFSFLVNLICDRRDQVLREYAVVLLSNLSRGDPTASRAIALQSGSVSGLITFLEECEETAMSNRQLFRQQPEVNCGTTRFIMMKAARTLMSIASVTENKSTFLKHQLRLLSLSMSQYLGGHVTSIVSSVLYELTHEST